MVVEDFVVFELFFADLLSKDGPDDLLLLLLLLFDADLLIEEDSDDLLFLSLFDVLILFDASLRLLISEDLSADAVLTSLLPTFYQPATFE